MRLLKTSSAAVTQLDIQSVQAGMLVLSANRYRLALETSSVNFELKSEAEQDALIETYQSFLNSVGSRIQIIVRIREIDLDDYLSDLDRKSRLETLAVWRNQLATYGEFVKSLVSVNQILSRSFYVVVPHDGDAKLDLNVAHEQLNLRAEIVGRGLERLGMHVRQLSSLEILNLFYAFYNPLQAKTQPLREAAIQKIHNAVVEKAK